MSTRNVDNSVQGKIIDSNKQRNLNPQRRIKHKYMGIL